MSAVRVFLSLDRKSLGSIAVTPLVNKIIQEARDCNDANFRIELVHFLGMHVYLKLNKIQKAIRCFEDAKMKALIQKEPSAKRQQYLVVMMRRKQIRAYLQIWSMVKNDKNIVEKILKYSEMLVKKLSTSPSPLDKLTILKSFLTVAKAYLSLGLIDDALKNLSKGLVCLNAFSLTGPFLLHSKMTFLFARVYNIRGRQDEAMTMGRETLLRFQTFFGEHSPRTKAVYRFMQRVCAKADKNKLDPSGQEGDHYADTDDEADQLAKRTWQDRLDQNIKAPVSKALSGGLDRVGLKQTLRIEPDDGLDRDSGEEVSEVEIDEIGVGDIGEENWEEEIEERNEGD